MNRERTGEIIEDIEDDRETIEDEAFELSDRKIIYFRTIKDKFREIKESIKTKTKNTENIKIKK